MTEPVTGIEITGEQTSSYITPGPFISAIYINWWRFATRRILIKTMMPLNFVRAKCISTAWWSSMRLHNFPCFITPTLNGGKINNYRWQTRPGSCIIEAWVGNVIITIERGWFIWMNVSVKIIKKFESL